MKVPLKLNSIDQEHLQELYNAAGVARDELPYTESFEELWQGFQDRTFKNADREQLFAAIIKYVRSSSNAAGQIEASPITDEQIKQLKAVLSRHLVGGKILPYSDAFETARGEFNKVASTDYDDIEVHKKRAQSTGPNFTPARRYSELLVAAVAHHAIGAVFATAKMDGFGLFRLVFERNEIAALVAAVAERLAGAFAAGTPPVALACFHFNGKGAFLGDYGLLVRHFEAP